MKRKKYSEIYKDEDSGRSFRYNYENQVLEYLQLYDYDDNDNKFKLVEPIVIDSIGLSVSNWKENPQYWIEQYDMQIEEEVSYLASFL